MRLLCRLAVGSLLPGLGGLGDVASLQGVPFPFRDGGCLDHSGAHKTDMIVKPSAEKKAPCLRNGHDSGGLGRRSGLRCGHPRRQLRIQANPDSGRGGVRGGTIRQGFWKLGVQGFPALPLQTIELFRQKLTGGGAARLLSGSSVIH